MVFYETFATYEAYTSTECAAKFLEVADNAGIATLISMAYIFRTYLSSIPYVGGLLITLITLLLNPNKTGNYMEYSIGMLDAYFLCAMGEPGFSQELYDGDFTPKMAYIKDLRAEAEQVTHIPYWGIFKLITNGLQVRDVLGSFAGSMETTE